MAQAKLAASQLFAVGASVSAYNRSPGADYNPAALGAAVATATVAADGTVTFTGLTNGAPYWLAAATPGAAHVSFSADTPGDQTISGTLTVTGAATLQAGATVTGGTTSVAALSSSGAFTHTGTTVGLNGNTPVAKAGAITAPTAPGAAYVQAEAASMKTAVDAIRTALTNIGITA